MAVAVSSSTTLHLGLGCYIDIEYRGGVIAEADVSLVSYCKIGAISEANGARAPIGEKISGLVGAG